MLFKIVFIIFYCVVIKVYCCPLGDFPCITPNGTSGRCVKADYCSYINKLKKSDPSLKPSEENEYAEKSVCGIALDRSRMYCCDNEVLAVYSRSKNPGTSQDPCIIVNVKDKDKVAENSSGNISSTSTTQNLNISTEGPSSASPTSTSYSSTSTSSPSEAVYPIKCRTPDGEQAQCTSVHNCPILMHFIRKPNRTTEEIQFLKESQCGYSNGHVLVCCGSASPLLKASRLEEQQASLTVNSATPATNCGVQNITLPNRVFGGVSTESEELPWVALLEYESHDGKNGGGHFLCGGCLISSRYVLTAAHCTIVQHFKLLTVRLGEWDYENPKKDCGQTQQGLTCTEAVQSIPVEVVITHPQYDITTKAKYNDIALIRLKQDVQITRYVSPICLPTLYDYIPPGERLTVAGWGLINYGVRTTVKQKVELPIIARSQCSVMFEGKLGVPIQIGKGQFCAGGEDGKDSCAGDSGAPLMRQDPITSRWYIVGVVSFGSACGREGYYGVYTKISQYIPWIYSTVVP